tara:strand:- start:88 stop:324 length:237 start_codon:yes stop_codon:yes gene_type:complete
MKNTGTNKIFSGTNDFIKTTFLLIVLGAIVQVTGTTFFGVNLLPIIIAVIVFVVIITGLASDKRTLNWINKKLSKVFK